MTQLWVCGKAIDQTEDKANGHCDTTWSLHGVFSSEEKAKAACVDETFFIGPTDLDYTWPLEDTEWAGAYFPLAKVDAEYRKC